MGKFNYKRGLLRVYAVVSVLWMATVLVVAVRDLPISDWSVVSERPDDGTPALNTPNATTATQPDALDKLIAGMPRKRRDIFDVIAPESGTYWASRIALTVLPPALCYASLFLVVPWIVRGFKGD
jgi:hypothetical protein